MVALMIWIYLIIGFAIGSVTASFIYHEEYWDRHINDKEELKKRIELRGKFNENPSNLVVPILLIFFTFFWLPGMLFKK
jgi:hypothetical protein